MAFVTRYVIINVRTTPESIKAVRPMGTGGRPKYVAREQE